MAQFGYEASRSGDIPQFGNHSSFDALEADLEAKEPWEKPAYLDLPDEERTRLEHWSALKKELTDRYGRSHS